MKDSTLKRKLITLSVRGRTVKTVYPGLAAKVSKPIKAVKAYKKASKAISTTKVKKAAATAKAASMRHKQSTDHKKLRFALSIGVLFIIAGSLLAYPTLKRVWGERHHIASAPAPAPVRTPAIEADTQVSQKVEGKPVRLVVSSLHIDVQVADGIYNAKTQTWSLSTNKAHYALMTPEPNNQEGNTFIYGHNRAEVFSRLSKLNKGETAEVYTSNNRVFTYKYRSSYETNPNDSSLFAYQGPPILTLQTCSGLWYQNRYLMTFDLVKVV